MALRSRYPDWYRQPYADDCRAWRVGIGVGGLEAESVMLGRAVYLRLREIIGVELSGQVAAGMTATDIVLALTEFLRRQKVVSAYLEFYGEGVKGLTAERSDYYLEHDARVWGDSGAVSD